MTTFVLPFLGPITFDVVFNLDTPRTLGWTFVSEKHDQSLHVDCWDRTFIVWRRT
ncbi:MAG: hypothetical protein LLG14_20440 [Nocardiaceae bacterium]|nr:hypothetical protein [Nocardiaceae bacterium]